MSTPVTGPLANYPGLNSPSPVFPPQGIPTPAVLAPAPSPESPPQGVPTWQIILMVLAIVLCVFIMAYIGYMGGVIPPFM